MTRTRGKQRFGGITYAQVAEWVGLKTSSVQSYSQRGVFDVHDLADLLQWINGRRKRAGLPLIGLPPEKKSPLDTAENGTDSVSANQNRTCVAPCSGYNSRTGEFQET